MPIDLTTKLRADARNIFAATDRFGEVFTYYPLDNTGTPKALTAVIRRGVVDPMDMGEGDANALHARVSCPNDPDDDTKGIVLLTPGADTGLCVMEEGKAAVKVRVTRLISSDPGMWVFQVTK